jgi:hypothetical protein
MGTYMPRAGIAGRFTGKAGLLAKPYYHQAEAPLDSCQPSLAPQDKFRLRRISLRALFSSAVCPLAAPGLRH